MESSKTKASTRSLKRHFVASDHHPFVGRIFDLSIVALHFDSYEELARHADCKYAFDVNEELTFFVRRIESLNLAGSTLWPDPLPKDFSHFPVSRHEWLTIAGDVFLMRYISVVDCALLLVNEVYETSLDRGNCTTRRLSQSGAPEAVLSIIESMRVGQGDLRRERNARVHHGIERNFSSDYATLQIAASFERNRRGLKGHDQHGRRINVEGLFKEGLVELQREFNTSTRRLVGQLDRLYDALEYEFEARFAPRFRDGPFGRGKPGRS